MSEASKSDPLAKRGREKRQSKRGRKPNSGGAKTGDLGRALRTVYDTTLREEVPPDFLDLLGKLR